jgi:hypothetical protein
MRMANLREWVRRLWGTLRLQRDDRDLEQELRLHVELDRRHICRGLVRRR